MAGSRKLVDAYVQLSARGSGALNTALGNVVNNARRAYGALSNIAQIAIGNALASGITSALGALQKIPGTMISANAAFETAKVGLEVLLGSADAAKARIENLRQFSASTPFEMPGILQTSKQLEMANVPAEKHMEVLRMTGDMASAAGVDISELGMWVSRSYAAIQAGKPWGEAAQRMSELGVLSVEGRAKLEAMAESGASSAEVWAAFEAEMGRFNGMMEKQSKTFTGLMSTLSDSVNQFLMVAGGPLFVAAQAGLDALVSVLGGEGATSAATAVADAMVSGFQAVASFVAPLVPLFQELVAAVWGSVSAGGEMGGVFASLGGVAQSALGLALSMATALWEILGAVGETIWSVIIAALEMMGFSFESKGQLATTVLDSIIAGIDTVAASFRNWDLSLEIAWLYLQNFWENTKAVMSALGQNIMIVFQNLPAYIEAVVQAGVTMLGNLATNIQIAFRFVFDWIKSWFSGGSGGWTEAFANAVQAVWDGMKWLIDTIWGALKSLWGAVTSGFTKGLDIASANYADAIKNATDENGKPKLEFIPITKGVTDAFKDLPEMVAADTKTARERYGSELEAIDREWAKREQDRKDKAKAVGDELAKQIDDRVRQPIDDGRKPHGEGAGGKAGAKKGSAAAGGKKGEGGGEVIGAEQWWGKIQKAMMDEKKSEEAQKTRKEGVELQKKTNQKLDKLIDVMHGGAMFA